MAEALPRSIGGRGIKGMAEIFAPGLFNGRANFMVPIALPPGQDGFQPEPSPGDSAGNVA